MANDNFKDKDGKTLSRPAPVANAPAGTPEVVMDHVARIGTPVDGYWIYNRESTTAGTSTWRAVRFEPANSK
jgi:hypothetical protein